MNLIELIKNSATASAIIEEPAVAPVAEMHSPPQSPQKQSVSVVSSPAAAAAPPTPAPAPVTPVASPIKAPITPAKQTTPVAPTHIEPEPEPVVVEEEEEDENADDLDALIAHADELIIDEHPVEAAEDEEENW